MAKYLHVLNSRFGSENITECLGLYCWGWKYNSNIRVGSSTRVLVVSNCFIQFHSWRTVENY